MLTPRPGANDPWQSQISSGRSRSSRWAVLLLVAACGAALGRYVLPGALGQDAPSAEPKPVAPRGPYLPEEQATIGLFEKVSSSVVYISPLEFRRRLFSEDVFETARGTGSGFVWDTDGHVITNYHVIKDAEGARVTLHDKSSYRAALVGVAPDKDIAVLKIDAPSASLHPVSIGASAELRVGQSVFAIGNPFGLDYTLTTGVVSALNRQIRAVTGRTIQGVIQTDAAINPGNSGGPLLDSAGRLIGINTSIVTPSGGSAGVGFAVPVDVVNSVVPQLIAYGKVIRPGLGAVLARDEVSQRLGIKGLIVVEVQPGSAAARAGLRGVRQLRNGDVALGDVIVKVNGTSTPTWDTFLTMLERFKVGDQVRLTLMRDNKEVEVTTELQPIEESP